VSPARSYRWNTEAHRHNKAQCVNIGELLEQLLETCRVRLPWGLGVIDNQDPGCTRQAIEHPVEQIGPRRYRELATDRADHRLAIRQAVAADKPAG
jgi:hypothetical protein